MADRGAIVSQYLYCEACEQTIARSGLGLVRHPDFPIYTGQARGIGGPELWINTLAALRELRPCHRVRFAILADDDEGALVTLTPDGELEPSPVTDWPIDL